MCTICKKVINDPGSLTVHRDDAIIVYLDKFPRTRGHLCVSPVLHAEDLFQEDVALAKRLMARVVESANLLRIWGARGINIGINIGREAGQQMSHFMVHVIPRFEVGDVVEIEPAFIDTPWRQKSITLTTEEEHRIRDELAALFAAHLDVDRGGDGA